MSYLEQLEKFIEKRKNEEPEAHSELEKRSMAIEIYSELLDENIWLCSNEEMATQVKSDDPHAVCYTVAELKELVRLCPTSEEIKRIHAAKGTFEGSKIMDSSLKNGEEA